MSLAIFCLWKDSSDEPLRHYSIYDKVLRSTLIYKYAESFSRVSLDLYTCVCCARVACLWCLAIQWSLWTHLCCVVCILVSWHILGGVLQPPTLVLCPQEDSLWHSNIQNEARSSMHGLGEYKMYGKFDVAWEVVNLLLRRIVIIVAQTHVLHF